MFLRKIVQRRQGHTYTYYALSETIRAPGGRVRQRTIIAPRATRAPEP